MKCNKCNTENPDNSRFCANCGEPLQNVNGAYQPNFDNVPSQQPKEPFYKKAWFIVLMSIFLPPVGIIFLWVSKKPRNIAGRIVLTIVLALWTLMVLPVDEEETVVTTPNAQTEENLAEEADENNTEETREIEEEQSNVLTVGSSFEKSGLKVTVNEANTDFQDYENEYGWNTPEDGMKYIMVSFTFENTGDSDEYVSIYDFDCYADNTTAEQVYTLDDSDFINTNLSSGRNVSFKTYYTVPVNTRSIELEYETSVWTGEKVVIKLQ